MRSLIFDMDGTLTDRFASYREALSLVHPQHALSADEIQSLCGHGGIAALIRACFPGAKAPQQMLKMRLFRDAYAEVLQRDGCHLYPGLPAILQALSQKRIPMAICTNQSTDNARMMLEQAGVVAFFVSIVGSDSTGFCKPDPRPLLLAMEQLQACRQTCCMVGDSLNDVHAAHAVGLPMWAVSYGSTAAEILAQYHPSRLFKTPEALCQALRATFLESSTSS